MWPWWGEWRYLLKTLLVRLWRLVTLSSGRWCLRWWLGFYFWSWRLTRCLMRWLTWTRWPTKWQRYPMNIFLIWLAIIDTYNRVDVSDGDSCDGRWGWQYGWQCGEKCIFQPAHNEMKCDLSIKESYSKGKKEIFTNAYGQAGRDDAPPSLMVNP